MKQTLGIVRYNFFGFFRNPKVIFTLFLEFVLSFLLTGRIMVVMDNYNTPVQAIEPFLWTFGDGTAVLLSSMLLLLLFSDLPKMTPVTPYQLIRTTKKKWLLGQFVYITFVTILSKLDIENPIIRINTAFKGCSSLEKISVLPRIYHN